MSSIPVPANNANKIKGIELGWSEGLASYLGVASQWVTTPPRAPAATYNVPTTMIGVANTSYDEVNPAGNAITRSVDLNSLNYTTGGVTTRQLGQGESDESAVARILWNIADAPSAADAYVAADGGPKGVVNWDRVSRGFPQVYRDMTAAAAQNGGTLVDLSEIDNYYLNTVSTTDRQRVNFGAIFQHFGVSPLPTGVMAGDPRLTAMNAAPTFTWNPQNNGANDTFRLLIWSNATLDTRLLNLAVPVADGNSYTLTAGQWATVTGMLGVKEFDVIGSDLLLPPGVMNPDGSTNYTGLAATGPYWSDAYPFTVAAPEPSTLALLLGGIALTPLLTRPRRRS